jgi:Helix-turn-helix domain
LALLGDRDVTTSVVEHAERSARFGPEYVQAVLSASGRRFLVVDTEQVDEDLVRDQAQILTSLCARLYGRRAAANRAARGVAAIGQDIPRALQAYRFALDPTPAQGRLLRSHCGAGRVAFNWGLAHVKAVMGQREAETTYGLPIEALTPPVSWSLYSLRKEWNAAKGEVAPWWGECSKEAFNTGLDGLARAPEELGGPIREAQGCAGGVSPLQVQAPQ